MLIDQAVRKRRRRVMPPKKQRRLFRRLALGAHRAAVLRYQKVKPLPQTTASSAAHNLFVCRIEVFDRGIARCFADVSGTLLPVEMPTALLTAKGLSPGMTFIWSAASPQPALEDILVANPGDDIQAPLPRQQLDEAVAERETGFWSTFLERR
jgi:hypothetical protein